MNKLDLVQEIIEKEMKKQMAIPELDELWGGIGTRLRNEPPLHCETQHRINEKHSEKKPKRVMKKNSQRQNRRKK